MIMEDATGQAEIQSCSRVQDAGSIKEGTVHRARVDIELFLLNSHPHLDVLLLISRLIFPTLHSITVNIVLKIKAFPSSLVLIREKQKSALTISLDKTRHISRKSIFTTTLFARSSLQRRRFVFLSRRLHYDGRPIASIQFIGSHRDRCLSYARSENELSSRHLVAIRSCRYQSTCLSFYLLINPIWRNNVEDLDCPLPDTHAHRHLHQSNSSERERENQRRWRPNLVAGM